MLIAVVIKVTTKNKEYTSEKALVHVPWSIAYLIKFLIYFNLAEYRLMITICLLKRI